MDDPYLKFAFSLQGLIRSIVRGDGGREFMDKCTREIAEALREIDGKTCNCPPVVAYHANNCPEHPGELR